MSRLSILIVVVVYVTLHAGEFSDGADELSTQNTNRVLIVAHRGLLRHAPENTAAAFESCLNLRLGFELDVQRTSDGNLVCVHDSTLDRTTNGKGRVSDKTWARLQTLDAGSWFSPAFRNERIPSIDEAFAMIARCRHKNILVTVDVKIPHPTVEKDLVALANKHGVLDQLLFIGRTIESADMRQRFKAADKTAPVARLANVRKELPAALKDKVADWVYVRFVPTREEVERIHKTGKRVILVGSTVAGNQPANWRTAAENGVDAILTDHPLELRHAIRPAAKR